MLRPGLRWGLGGNLVYDIGVGDKVADPRLISIGRRYYEAEQKKAIYTIKKMTDERGTNGRRLAILTNDFYAQ